MTKFQNIQAQTSVLFSDLGKRFEGDHIGLKPHLLCRAPHPFSDAGLTLIRECHFHPDELEKIEDTTEIIRLANGN